MFQIVPSGNAERPADMPCLGWYVPWPGYLRIYKLQFKISSMEYLIRIRLIREITHPISISSHGSREGLRRDLPYNVYGRAACFSKMA